jgi:hypothetical protein
MLCGLLMSLPWQTAQGMIGRKVRYDSFSPDCQDFMRSSGLLILFLTALSSVCIGTSLLAQATTSVNRDSTSSAADTVSAAVQATTQAKTEAKTEAKRVKPDDSLRLYIETRNEAARPDPYVTMLTVTKGSGAMKFQWKTKSGREKTLYAKLTRAETRQLFAALNVKKLSQLQPDSDPAVALFKQAVIVTHKDLQASFRYMIDPLEIDPELVDKSIKQQLGKNYDPHWKFIQYIRAINARFKL